MKLSWKDVYTQAKVNPSTSAWQRDRFLSYFNYTGSGRHRKYSEDSIEILSLISSMYNDSKTFDDITEALENRYGIPTSGDLVVQEELPQLDIIEGIREMLSSELAKRDESIERMLSKRDEAIDKLSQQVESLAQGSQERDRLLMEGLRRIEEKNRKWWRFWK